MSSSKLYDPIEQGEEWERTVLACPGALIPLEDFEREFEGKRIFTREVVEQAAKDVEQARNDRINRIYVKSIRGDGRVAVWPPQYGGQHLGASLSWFKYSTMVAHYERTPGPTSPYILNDGQDFAQLTTTRTILLGQSEVRQRAQRMKEPKEMPQYREFERQWEASPQWVVLKQKLEMLAGKVRAKNMVCMAMGGLFKANGFRNGELDSNVPPEEKKGLIESHCEQHIAAGCISSYLHEIYSRQDPDTAVIDICSFDPSYTRQDLVLLEHLSPPISIVSDPYHYLAINKNTLVISVACPAFIPNLEIIADMIYPSAPAAFLCDDVFQFSWQKEQKVACLDRWSPRVGQMLECYEKEYMVHSGAWADDAEVDRSRWLQQMVFYTRNDAKIKEVDSLTNACEDCTIS